MISNNIIIFYLIRLKIIPFIGGLLKMHQILHYFSIQTVDNYNRFIQKLRKKNNDSNLLCQFRRRTTFTFSLMLFLRTYSYKASFYHNVIKAQWQRSSNKQQGSRSANKLPPPQKKIWIFSSVMFIRATLCWRPIVIRRCSCLYLTPT